MKNKQQQQVITNLTYPKSLFNNEHEN